MENLKNVMKTVLVAMALVFVPAEGFCNYSNGVYVYSYEERLAYCGLGIGVMFILLLFAVIFFSIRHRTKREKMHLELLTEMVRQGMVPTSEQVMRRRVVEGKVAVDNDGRVVVRNKGDFSLVKVLLLLIGVVLFFYALDNHSDSSKFFGCVAMYLMVYAIMDMRNAGFIQNNIGTLTCVNAVLGLSIIISGLLFFRDFGGAFFLSYLPGAFILFYSIVKLDRIYNMPRFEFKIKRNGRVSRDAGIEENEVEKDGENAVEDTK